MRSLRVRLLVWLCLALCTLWGGVAAWMFAGMRHELRSVLDDRLIASARMVAGIVHQFKPENATPKDWGPMLNVVARDGVACEVSMLRSEVQTAPVQSSAPESDASGAKSGDNHPALIPASPLHAPRTGKAAKPAVQGADSGSGGGDEADDSKVLARTAGAPSFQAPLPLGFSTITKGGRGAPMCWKSTACALQPLTALMCAKVWCMALPTPSSCPLCWRCWSAWC